MLCLLKWEDLIRSEHHNWIKKKGVIRKECWTSLLHSNHTFCDNVRGSGQSLGVNTHLNSTSTHVVTGKNTCFTRLLHKKEERRQPTVNHYNVTRGGVLQQRGWVGKQLSSRRAPVLTFSVDLDTENTWQCHSLHFKSTGCLTKPLHFPVILKTTFHTVWKGRKTWRSLIDVRRERQKASHVVTVNNREL